MKKRKVVIITDCPTPYRVAHYEFLQKRYTDYDFHIIFSIEKPKSDLRQWKTTTDPLHNVYFLPHFIFLKKRRYDDKQIIVTFGVGNMLKKIQPNIVVCMEYNPTSLQTILWCQLHKIPFISLTDGTLYSERNIGYLQKLSRKYIMRFASAFITSSTKAKEKVENYRVNKPIYVSLLTEDIDKFLVQKNSSGNATLIYVGSLIERKGIDLLFIALSKLQCNWNLKVVGTGILENDLRKLALDLHIDGRIEFLGFKQQEALVEIYKQADAFVFPTREDCYGLVILEAMCASLPVVCSKYADGAYDLIDDGISGYIVDPYDADNFAIKIMEILDRNKASNIMGRRAYKKALSFSFENVSIEFMKAVEETEK